MRKNFILTLIIVKIFATTTLAGTNLGSRNGSRNQFEGNYFCQMSVLENSHYETEFQQFQIKHLIAPGDNGPAPFFCAFLNQSGLEFIDSETGSYVRYK